MSNKLINRDNVFNKQSPFPVKRNGFDLTHKVISSWDMGILYPVSCHEVYPNDYEKTQIQTKMILETLFKPIYQSLKVHFKEFDVAYRNLWKHWRNYYTGGRKGDFTAQEPKVNLFCKSNIKGSLFDYLGFPLRSQLGGDVYVSAFPFIAYDFIYFWNFINAELQENIVYDIQDKIYYRNGIKSPYIMDELCYFAYYGDDFYLINDDGIPVYTRMLGFPRFFADKAKIIDNTSRYGRSSRYSYITNTPADRPLGLVVDRNGTLVALENNSSDSIGKISNQDYRDLVNIGFLYNVNWHRDYYTSAHLSTQLGSPTSIVLDTHISAEPTSQKLFSFVDNGLGISSGSNNVYTLQTNSSASAAGQAVTMKTGFGAGTVPAGSSFLIGGKVNTEQAFYDYLNQLTIGSASFSQNDFRLFWQIGMIKEGMLFSNKAFEYANVLEYFFGRSPNSRELQQPNYIGGFSSYFYTSEVVQTSETSDGSALGEYAGKGQLIDSGYIDPYTFDEIGLSMLIMYIMPDQTYQNSQGVNRQWLRNDRFDYYNPALAHIGLQEVQNQEVYAQGNSEDIEPFGYTMAFNELRYIPDVVTSDMRDTLDFWHLARKYTKLPVLNSSYLSSSDISKRIFSTQMPDVPNITGVINIVKIAYRNLPELSIPELLDHRY